MHVWRPSHIVKLWCLSRARREGGSLGGTPVVSVCYPSPATWRVARATGCLRERISRCLCASNHQWPPRSKADGFSCEYSDIYALRVASDLPSRTADELLRKPSPCGIRAVRVASDFCGAARSTLCRIKIRPLVSTHYESTAIFSGSHSRHVAAHRHESVLQGMSRLGLCLLYWETHRLDSWSRERPSIVTDMNRRHVGAKLSPHILRTVSRGNQLLGWCLTKDIIRNLGCRQTRLPRGATTKRSQCHYLARTLTVILCRESCSTKGGAVTCARARTRHKQRLRLSLSYINIYIFCVESCINMESGQHMYRRWSEYCKTSRGDNISIAAIFSVVVHPLELGMGATVLL